VELSWSMRLTRGRAEAPAVPILAQLDPAPRSGISSHRQHLLSRAYSLLGSLLTRETQKTNHNIQLTLVTNLGFALLGSRSSRRPVLYQYCFSVSWVAMRISLQHRASRDRNSSAGAIFEVRLGWMVCGFLAEDSSGASLKLARRRLEHILRRSSRFGAGRIFLL
jgi:hypothetical protein